VSCYFIIISSTPHHVQQSNGPTLSCKFADNQTFCHLWPRCNRIFHNSSLFCPLILYKYFLYTLSGLPVCLCYHMPLRYLHKHVSILNFHFSSCSSGLHRVNKSGVCLGKTCLIMERKDKTVWLGCQTAHIIVNNCDKRRRKERSPRVASERNCVVHMLLL